jgi:hypothetical protein
MTLQGNMAGAGMEILLYGFCGIIIFVNAVFATAGGVLMNKYSDANSITAIPCESHLVINGTDQYTVTNFCNTDCTEDYHMVQAIFWLNLIAIICNLISCWRATQHESKGRFIVFTMIAGFISFIIVIGFGISNYVHLPDLCKSHYSALWDFSQATFWICVVLTAICGAFGIKIGTDW